jgi:soluble lytic murein transglycosylase-like protein
MGRLGAAVQFAEIINGAAARYGLPPAIVAGVVAAESAFNPNAYRPEPTIGDGSRGLMQLLFRTARALGYTGAPAGLYDPATNVNLGAKHLRELYDTARLSGPLVTDFEAWTRALSAYNAGFSTVRPGDAKRDAAGVPINADYIARVRRWAARFSGSLADAPLGWLAVVAIAVLGLMYGRRVRTSTD